MRVALALAASLALPATASAQTPAPTAPAPTPAPTSAPAPTPAPDPTSAPGETAPTAPPADPAYGDHPEPSYDTRDFPAPRGKDVIIVSYPDRSKKNITTLAVLGGAGLLAGAIGLYFHMDWRSSSNEVATNDYTGDVWTAAHQDTYDRAHSSSIAAGVLYGLGGGLLLATAITYIATEPKAETMIIHPNSRPKRSALVAPTQGGAMIGGRWSF
jgi:hypothetical protein